VFDCAFRSNNGTRSIHYTGHLRMMAAVQPFLSGAISKTVNLPTGCTIEDIEDAYIQAWKMGLKAIAVYRDGCKRTQPLSTSATSSASSAVTPPAVAITAPPATVGPPPPRRHKLTRDRHSMTHKFAIGGHEGYITVGLYADGTPGEIFVRMAKEGSTIAGLVDSFATAVSIALQHGAPLALLVDKFKGTRFEPSGFTGNSDIPLATSIMDYVFRWLERFAARSVAPAPVLMPAVASTPPQPATPWVAATDAPPCHECGTLMVRNGACHKCPNCGSTSGCS
jgi:ribonucleoside-diphosphate reductase alpha chain